VTMLGGRLLKKAMAAERSIWERLFIIPFFDEALQIRGDAASIDLRLGSRFAIAKRRRLTHTDPYDDETTRTRGRFDEHYVPVGHHFVVHPGHFVLATTLEWLRLPTHLGAYVVGKSTLGRCGLSITNGAGVQPGFAGTLTLELTNVADVPMLVFVGQPVCQVFFHFVEQPKGRAREASGVRRQPRSGCSKRPMIGKLEAGAIDRFLEVGKVADDPPAKPRKS
jgi:dCTP deaminase